MIDVVYFARSVCEDNMKTLLIALSLSLAASSAALACTAEELQAKATEVSTKMQALAAKDPQKASEIGSKLASVQTTQATDMEGACKVYDELSAELEKAE
ncbi:hypothetical protein D3C80_1049170 [compost metagenome]